MAWNLPTSLLPAGLFTGPSEPRMPADMLMITIQRPQTLDIASLLCNICRPLLCYT